MKSHKLVHLIGLLPEKSRENLRKFVSSPVHNSHQGVLELLNFILKTLDSPNPVWSKKIIFEEVFQETTFNDQRFRLHLSYLKKVVEQFLIWEELNLRPSHKNRYLLYSLERLGADQLFGIMAKRFQKQSDKSILRDLDYYQQQHQFLALKYESTEARDQPEGELLNAIDHTLDLYYFVAKLKYACKILTHQKVFNTTLEVTRMAPILAEIKDRRLHQLPAVGIYYHTYHILIDNAPEKHFDQLLTQITASLNTFPQLETRSFYLFAINYCIQQTNKGFTGYLETGLGLYKESLENGILFDGGQLSPYTYKNIIGFGLKLHRFEWVGTFIEQYKAYLPNEARQDFYNFSLARLAFAEGLFEKVTQLLNSVYIRDLFTQIDAKVLLMKANYELGDFQWIEYQLDSFKQLLRRRELLAYHREHYRNFHRFLSRIMRVDPWAAQKKAVIQTDLEANSAVMDKEWLLSVLLKNE